MNTKVDIKLGNIAMQKEPLSSKVGTGRHPQWNEVLTRVVMIDKNLQFASDMRVILYNCQKTMLLRRETWEVLGEFSVPVKSI